MLAGRLYRAAVSIGFSRCLFYGILPGGEKQKYSSRQQKLRASSVAQERRLKNLLEEIVLHKFN